MKQFALITVITIFVLFCLIKLTRANDLPPPLTVEQYNSLTKQERYGACYDYCLEENKLYLNALWSLMNRIEELVLQVQQLQAELQQYQIDDNMCGEKVCKPIDRRMQ